MNKRNQVMLENFSDKEIRYMLQYAEMYLEQSHTPDDGTLQGSILKRIKEVIIGSRK